MFEVTILILQLLYYLNINELFSKTGDIIHIKL